MKFPELAGEAALLERDGNLTGLTGVCKNKVDVMVRVCCSFSWTHMERRNLEFRQLTAANAYICRHILADQCSACWKSPREWGFTASY